MSAAASSSLLLSKAARFLAARAPGSFAKPLAVGSLIRPLRTLRTPLITAAGMDGAERGSASKAGISVSSGGGSGHTFPISPSTVLKIQKGDITVWSVDGSTDAIVSSRIPSLPVWFIISIGITRTVHFVLFSDELYCVWLESANELL
ncbi:hypothetical protein GW17_00048033 [Ensete ventricosum]|nr:hypothetical protein GW17_00048033 [Ensete ventricosum]